MTDTITFPDLDEARNKLAAKRDELGQIFAQAQPGGEGTIDLSKVDGYGSKDDVAAKIKDLNDELTDLSKDVDRLTAVHKAAQAVNDGDGSGEPGDGSQPTRDARFDEIVKGLGDLFVESDGYKARSGGNGPAVELKASLRSMLRPRNTLFETTAGWTPESTRTGRVVDDAQRPVEVTDLFPVDETSQAAVKYMEETTFTNNAAEVAEGGAYGEAALALTERTVSVQKIAVFLPVTDEQLEDEPMARSYINRRLPFMIRQRLDSQLLVGNGTSPNLEGVLNVTGVQTQAKGADSVPDAVYKAITKVRHTGYANPMAAVFHPNDWQGVRLLQTADGVYIWGSPADAGPERIWGLRVAVSSAITENTGLVGDFENFASLVVRRGLDVQVSNSHSDYFVKGKQAIRADIRVANPVFRPAAFCTVTGI